jgi:hypothetical protein
MNNEINCSEAIKITNCIIDNEFVSENDLKCYYLHLKKCDNCKFFHEQNLSLKKRLNKILPFFDPDKNEFKKIHDQVFLKIQKSENSSLLKIITNKIINIWNSIFVFSPKYSLAKITLFFILTGISFLILSNKTINFNEKAVSDYTELDILKSKKNTNPNFNISAKLETKIDKTNDSAINSEKIIETVNIIKYKNNKINKPNKVFEKKINIAQKDIENAKKQFLNNADADDLIAINKNNIKFNSNTMYPELSNIEKNQNLSKKILNTENSKVFSKSYIEFEKSFSENNNFSINNFFNHKSYIINLKSKKILNTTEFIISTLNMLNCKNIKKEFNQNTECITIKTKIKTIQIFSLKKTIQKNKNINLSIFPKINNQKSNEDTLVKITIQICPP